MRTFRAWVGVGLLLSSCNQSPQSEPATHAVQNAETLSKPGSPKPKVEAQATATAKKDPIKTPEVTRTHKSGLVTRDFKVGTGPEAQVGSKLTVRYRAMLADGTEFEGNYRPSDPAFTFELPKRGRVRGWSQGLLGMKAGGKRRIEVPAALGYGKKGSPANEPGEVAVPPDSDLVYLVELVKLQPPVPMPKAPSAYEGEPLSKKRLRGGLMVENYRVLQSGEVAALGDRVQVHYTGLLPDKTVFDATTGGRAPFQFILGDSRVIPGWNLGIVGMKVGELRKLKVPAKLAYGKKGLGDIPGNTPLVFLVELMKLEKAPAPKPKK